MRWQLRGLVMPQEQCLAGAVLLAPQQQCLADRFLQRSFTKFDEIMHCNGYYTVQSHSKSPILVPIKSSYTTSY